MNEQEQLVRKCVEHGKEKNLARDMDQNGAAKEKVKVHVHPKGPVQVDGVSNDVIKEVRPSIWGSACIVVNSCLHLFVAIFTAHTGFSLSECAFVR